MGKQLLLIEYQWKPSPYRSMGTVLSKMINFRGEKLFRVGLKNQARSSTLLFMTFNLRKMGFACAGVTYISSSRHDEDEIGMMTLQKESSTYKPCSIQLYTKQLPKISSGTRSFSFQLQITSITQDYEIQRLDCLMGEQLWSSAVHQTRTDFELIAEGKRFPVHKFILAARSPIFAAQFSHNKFLPTKRRTNFVDATIMKQFLKFIYTGELEGGTSDQLLELATTYGIETLKSLCEEISSSSISEISNLAMLLRTEDTTVVEIQPKKSAEIYFNPEDFIFSFTWEVPTTETLPNLFEDNTRMSEAVSIYSEKLFTAKAMDIDNGLWRIMLFVHYPKNIGCIIEEVTYRTKQSSQEYSDAYKMKAKPTKDKNLLYLFTTTVLKLPQSIKFSVRLVSTITNFNNRLVDSTAGDQFWAASVDRKQTDVEFLIERETFAAHRILLSARSPVFSAMFNSGMEEDRTGKVNIADVDPDTFKQFLYFLYTGKLLPGSFNNENLFQLADKYQVETLANISRPIQPSNDIEDALETFLAC